MYIEVGSSSALALEIGKLRLVVSCVVEDLLRARKSKPSFEFSVQKYNFTLFEIPTLRKKNALECLLTITWNKVHNGLMKATDNRLETGLFVSFYSVVNPFLFAAERGKEKSLPCMINLATKKSNAM